jgi:RNA polymerase sigma factor for flagellar operon FliA
MAPAQIHAKNYGKKDDSYRDQLITEYLPYVKRIVHRIAVHLPSTIDIEDLMNVGVIGLIQAVDRYDPKRDNLEPIDEKSENWKMSISNWNRN